jgi:hypothetical protein
MRLFRCRANSGHGLQPGSGLNLGLVDGSKEVSFMFKNYIIVTLRNIRRNKGYSIINIVGLAMSPGLSLLIIQMIVSFTSFDRFQKNKERIYRLNTTSTAEKEERRFVTSPYPLLSALQETVPGIVAALGMAAVLSQTIRAARTNPADILRHE